MIQTEQTPNPDSLKFISENIISAVGTEEFQQKELSKIDNEFIKELLNFEGVELVLLSEKFISVKKFSKTSWDILKPMVISHMNEYFEKNKKPILNVKTIHSQGASPDSEIVKQIIEVLDSKIRPAVARDGGDIKFKSFNNGVVKVELQGSCSGCPSSLMTLKQGVQNLLCHYIQEVKSVEAI
jgi:Fe-S cluster biogenesis protein NfuA